ncbi:hypothetical protein ACFFWD_21070 [Bradyrhizobium erythrophlei]|uniref:hypothetical protein n=1 Tax=Bradyrhizobium erythrophlei TaxID=1437360 RepID=UPI0035EDFAE3
MSTKHLFAISLALPLLAMSASAHAEHNYQHRPIQPSEYGALAQAGAPKATRETELQRRRSAQPVGSAKACTYQGGPKSGLWSCR